MSVNVYYKNNLLSSFSNGGKILNTSGKYLEDNITIQSAEAIVGGAYARTEVCPLTTFTAPSDQKFATLPNSARLIDNAVYVVTYDNVEYTCTCNELWGTDRFLGDLYLTWERETTYTAADSINPFAVEDWDSNNYPIVYPVDKNQHTIRIERLVFIEDPVQVYYTGADAPASNFGNNGDVYFQTSQ